MYKGRRIIIYDKNKLNVFYRLFTKLITFAKHLYSIGSDKLNIHISYVYIIHIRP